MNYTIQLIKNKRTTISPQPDPLRVPAPEDFYLGAGLDMGDMQINEARARLLFLKRRLRLTNERRVSVDGRRMSMGETLKNDTY